MTDRIPPAVKQAILFVCRRVGADRYRPGMRLPPVRVIAREAGVSVRTMLKALTELKKARILVGMQGRRYAVAPNATGLLGHLQEEIEESRGSEPRSRLLWRNVADVLRRDILNNIYTAGDPIPSLKVLQYRYHVSYPTLKRALELLRGEGILLPARRGYRVAPMTAPNSNASVGLVLYVRRRGDLLTLGAVNEDLVRSIGIRCVKAHVRLKLIVCFRQQDAYLFSISPHRVSREIDDEPEMLGYIYPVLGQPEEQRVLMRKLSGIKKPISIIDEVGGWEVPPGLTRPGVRVFPVGISSRPARSVAHYLLSLRHKHIAYISPYHHGLWSRLRCQGLRDIFQSAGLPDNVHAFTLMRTPWARHSYAEDGHLEYDMGPLQQAYEMWKEGIPDYMLRYIEPRMNWIFSESGEWGETARKKDELFEGALRDTRITAWVCANDAIASDALEFLGERGIDVPGRLSVMGFDNSLESVQRELTTFDFNMGAVTAGALSHVLSPPPPTRKRLYKPVEYDGMLVERSTTARPK